MDNKITKRRLSDFLAYEWILMLVAAIGVIIALELLYGALAVKLSMGQSFKYYYDENIDTVISGDFRSVLEYETGKNGKTFSYDVLELSSENLLSSYNVLSARLSAKDGDMIFTDTLNDGETDDAGYDKTVRARTVIDSFQMYTFEGLLTDAQDYLATFLKEGVKTGDKATDRVLAVSYDNLDGEKIDANFLKRMKKDNRYRTAESKAAGKVLERERIEKLCDQVKDFNTVMTVGDGLGLFYRYTKYEQIKTATERNNDNSKETYNTLYLKEIDAGRGNAAYGLKLDKLTGGTDASAYFRVLGESTAKNVVLCAFSFKGDPEYTPDLEFERISFINTIIRQCSNILG